MCKLSIFSKVVCFENLLHAFSLKKFSFKNPHAFQGKLHKQMLSWPKGTLRYKTMKRTRAGDAERPRGQASEPLPGWLLHAQNSLEVRERKLMHHPEQRKLKCVELIFWIMKVTQRKCFQ